MLVIGFIILFVIAYVANDLGYFEMNEQGNRDFLIWSDPAVIDWDKRILGREYIEKYDGA